MTQKIHGAAYPGVWVERQVVFAKITFNVDISAITATHLRDLDGAAVGTGTVADSSFGVVESALVQALKGLEQKATVLGISAYNDSDFSVDVMLGYAEGWFSDAAGSIASAVSVINAEGVVTVAGTSPTTSVGTLVRVVDGYVTYDIDFAAWDGTMPIATAAAGQLVSGPGATSGATPTNSSTGTAGYYPV